MYVVCCVECVCVVSCDVLCAVYGPDDDLCSLWLTCVCVLCCSTGCMCVVDAGQGRLSRITAVCCCFCRCCCCLCVVWCVCLLIMLFGVWYVVCVV